MTDDPWHFPRRELAESTLALLKGRLARALTLFAPRRTGKTEFLLKDLGPLAESQGHRVVYVSFWQAPLSPLAVLLNALEKSLRRGSFADKVRLVTVALTPKLKLSSKVPGASADAEIDLTRLTGKPPADMLLHLDDLIGRIARTAKPTLLLLDEVQELARDSANQPLVAALRTSLDKHRDGIATVFTGSSREGLQAMFSSRTAPFFHFATPIDLPVLDHRFVDHELAAFAKASKRKLERNVMLETFEKLDKSPYLFRGVLELLLANPALAVADALARLRDRLAVELRYPEQWLALTPLQRALALQLARGIDRPFSKDAREAMGKMIDTEAPTIARVQTALRRLSALGIATRWDERWSIDDGGFRTWMLERPAKQLA